MIRFYKQLIWLPVIIIILIIMYVVLNWNNLSTRHKLFSNIKHKYNPIPSRKKMNKKYAHSKKIHTTPKSVTRSIQSITNDLKTKLTETMKNKPKRKFTIKLFYADWCGHCKNFKPIWNELKNKYSNNITFIEIDCSTESPQIEYVKGYPTVSVYKNYNEYVGNYKGMKDKISFEAFIKKLI